MEFDISFEMPPFHLKEADWWFDHLEEAFEVFDLLTIEEKINYLLPYFNSNWVQKIKHILRAPKNYDRYGMIKDLIMKAFHKDRKKRMDRLKDYVPPTDKCPSEVFKEMKKIGPGETGLKLTETMWRTHYLKYDKYFKREEPCIFDRLVIVADLCWERERLKEKYKYYTLRKVPKGNFSKRAKTIRV